MVKRRSRCVEATFDAVGRRANGKYRSSKNSGAGGPRRSRGFAWAQDEGMFAAVFATEAAWATVEAIDLSF